MKKIIFFLIVLVLISGCGETTQEPQDKQGLSLETKQLLFYELVKFQDTILFEDEDYAQQMEDSYKVFAHRYEITEKEARSIAIEGVQKGWDLP